MSEPWTRFLCFLTLDQRPTAFFGTARYANTSVVFLDVTIERL